MSTAPRSSSLHFRPAPFRRFGALALVLALGIALTACQARFPGERIPKMAWLVVPFDQPPAFDTDTRAIQGWWFGARTIRQNARAGELVAETLMRKMAAWDFVHLYSSIDLRYYFADKREALANAYPYLQEDEIDQLLDDVPDLDYARELGADKLITGRILRQYMAENRTIHWWWSVVEIRFDVVDVATGEVEWSRRYQDRRQFASQVSVMEDVVDQFLEDLKQEYFRPLAAE